MTWRHSSPRHSSTPSSAAEGGPAATGGSRDSGTVIGSRPDDRRSPGRGPLTPRPRARPPEPALRTAPAHRALCEPSAPPCGPVSFSRRAAPRERTTRDHLRGQASQGLHALQSHWPLPPRLPRIVRRTGRNTPEKRTVHGNVGAPRSQCPGRRSLRAAVPPRLRSPRRRCPRLLLRPAAADPRARVSHGPPQTPTRAPPAGLSRMCGPPGWDGLCVNCRNQCGPDWHILGRSPPD